MKSPLIAIRPPEPVEKEIQHIAYGLWEEAGRPPGRDQEFWFTARERLRGPVQARELPRRAASSARNAQPAGASRR